MMQYKPDNASLSTIHNPPLAAGGNHNYEVQPVVLLALTPSSPLFS